MMIFMCLRRGKIIDITLSVKRRCDRSCGSIGAIDMSRWAAGVVGEI